MPRTDLAGGLEAAPLASGTEWSRLFALILGFAFLAALSVVILYNKWNRADLDGEHATHILTQLHSFGGSGPGSVVARSPDALDDPATIRNIRGLFSGERSDETTVRSASLEILRTVGSELRNRAPSASKVPVRAMQEAFLTALFGAMAIVPVAAWRAATRTGGSAVPDLPALITAGQMVLDVGIGSLTAFPYTGLLFGLSLSVGIIGVSTVWALWWAPPAVLTVLAATYWTLERRVDTDRDLTGPPVRTWAVRFVALAAATWFVGASLATIAAALAPVPLWGRLVAGSLMALSLIAVFVRVSWAPRARKNWKWYVVLAALGFGSVHELAAFLAAVVVAGAVVGVWIRATLSRWSRSAQRDGRDALALDVTHSLTVTAAALTAPLMVGYAAVAIGTGRVIAVAAVVVDAPDTTVIALGILAVMVALTVAVAFFSRFRDIRRGFRRALSVQAVRVALFGRALPFALMVVTAVLALAFLGGNLVATVAVTLAVGFIARFAYKCYHHVTYRYYTRTPRDKTAGRVVVNGRQVTDADGDPVYIADVNGHRTAHRRVDPLVHQIRRDGKALLREGAAETGSFPRYYYTEGVRRGKVDMEAVADELLGDVKTRFVANVQQTDAGADEILDKLRSEYPPHVVDKVINDLKGRGRVSRREDRFVWLGQ